MTNGIFGSSDCPTLRVLYLFSVGRLSDASLETLADHIGICPVCLQLMRRLESSYTGVEMFVDSTDSNLDRELQAILCALKSGSDVEQLSSAPYEIPSPDFLSEHHGPRITEIGQYELGALLGEGAMGSVYRGWHKHLKKHVVVKLLSPDRRVDEASIARFMREMEAVGRLGDHPHIVRAVDAGSDKGDYFIVMDFVDGCDLRRVLKQLGRINFHDVAEIGRQLALALSHIRAHRMVHRDIKPSNIFLTTSGTIKLMDLGLALFQRSDASCESTKRVVGTADYIAPEQWSVDTLVDGRADLYALGCTMFELLTGSPPFDHFRGFRQKKQAHSQIEPASVSQLDASIPQALANIISRMLAKKPSDRFDHPDQLANALAPFAVGSNLVEVAAQAIGSGRDTLTHASEPTEVYVNSRLDPQPFMNRRRMLSIALGSGGGAIGLTAIGLYVRNSLTAPAAALLPEKAFHTAFFAGEKSEQTFRLDPIKQELVVNSTHGMLGLAWHELPQSTNFSLKVRIRQEQARGECGLFWGANASRFFGTVGLSQHCLFLDATSQKSAALFRYRELGITRTFVDSEKRAESEKIVEIGSSPVVTISMPSERAIEIVLGIQDGRIGKAICNGVSLTELVSGTEGSHAAGIGALGVFVRNGTAIFSGFELTQFSPESL